VALRNIGTLRNIEALGKIGDIFGNYERISTKSSKMCLITRVIICLITWVDNATARATVAHSFGPSSST